MVRRGYTLIEMLAVLAVVALVMAAIPPLRPDSGLVVEAAARRIAAGLRQARGDAIGGNRQTVFEVDVDARTYAAGGPPQVLAPELSLRLVTAEGELRSEGRGAIRFFPDGSSSGGRITVSRNERRVAVDVHWLSGKVTVHD